MSLALAAASVWDVARSYISTTVDALVHGRIFYAFSPFRLFHGLIFLVVYVLVQCSTIIPFFKPRPPKKDTPLPKPYGRIAVIGAGLTGVSSAAHCISHNFEVVLFEKKKHVGGIWSDVNKTSALQLNSLIYRFHPGVLWKHTYPSRDEILSETTRIWEEYKLKPRTRLNTPVRSIRRFEGTSSPGARWIVNDGDDGPFDAVIVTVGTCGRPHMVGFPGMPRTHWAKEQDDEEKAINEMREKYPDRSFGGTFSMGKSGGNLGKSSDSEAKRREKEKKERERQERERKERERRRKDGRAADEFPSLSAAASHPSAKDSATLKEAIEGEAPHERDPRDPDSPSYSTVAAQPPAPDSAALNAEPEKPRQRDDDEESETGLWRDVEDDRETAKTQGSEPGDHDEHERRDDPESRGLDADGEVFGGTVLHSSELDEADLKGKTVLIVGSGASGVEAAETALARGAKKVTLIAREDKWIIPRNTFIDTLISAQPFGRQMPLSFLWEWFIRTFHYRDLKDLAPVNLGIYEGTPIVNDAFLDHIRQKRVEYVRGDTQRFTSTGILVNVRPRGTKPGDKPKSPTNFNGDVVILATGFQRPSLDFLPGDLFPESFQRPDLYLQNFSTCDWTVLCTNSAYMSAIGTVGHFHIGIYTRILLLFLLEPNARPEERDMQLWVNVVRFIKRGAKGGALGFFTYMELVIWFLTFHVFRPDRLRWVFFTMQGWGVPVID